MPHLKGKSFLKQFPQRSHSPITMSATFPELKRLYKLPTCTVGSCMINPCYWDDLSQLAICAESHLAKNRKKNWQVFMVREIIPRYCSRAATDSQGVYPYSPQFTSPQPALQLALGAAPQTSTKPYSNSLPTPGMVHSPPLMSPPPFHTARQSTLSQSHEQPYSSTLPPLECILSIFPLQCMHNCLQSSAPYVPKSNLLHRPLASDVIARATARCQDLGNYVMLAFLGSPWFLGAWFVCCQWNESPVSALGLLKQSI